MDTPKVNLDIPNLKSLAPVLLAIGVGLGILAVVGGFFLAGIWGLTQLAAWAFCGGLYSNKVFHSGSSGLLNNAVNGAISAAIAEVAFNIVIGIVVLFRQGMVVSFLSVTLFLEAALVGALGALAWHMYLTNKK